MNTQRQSATKLFKSTLMRLGLIAVLLALFTSLLGPVPSVYAATTRTIDVNNIDDHEPLAGCTLREAIDLANSNTPPGQYNDCTVVDIIGVPPAPIIYQINLPAEYTYTLTGTPGEDLNATGDLDIRVDLAGVSIAIIGQGVETTVISGGGVDRVFDIWDAPGSGLSVSLIGVTIGKGVSDDSGGGIRNQNANLEIIDSEIISNESPEGGGISNLSGTVTLTRSSISDNEAIIVGGGISNNQGTVIIEDNSTIRENDAISFSGGGIRNTGALTIENSSVISNTVPTGWGGGLENVSGIAHITNSTFSGNIANGEAQGHGGAITNLADATLIINNSTLSENHALGTTGGNGGGIENSGVLKVTGSDFQNNSAYYRGGGILNQITGTTAITNTTIISNTAGYQGGGIFNNIGNVIITDSDVCFNVINSSSVLNAEGGGIYNTNNATLTIDGSNIISNTVNSDFDSRHAWGGGIFNTSGAIATISDTIIADNLASISATLTSAAGGGIFNTTNATLNISGSDLSGNLALGEVPSSSASGGGLYNGFGATATITATIIAENQSKVSPTGTFAAGGGIYNRGTLNLSGSTLHHNTASLIDGSFGLGDGGGIYNNDGVLSISGSSLDNNESRYGGGIYQLDGTMAISYSTVSNNLAVLSGGGIYAGGYISSTITLTNSTFSANRTHYRGGGLFIHFGSVKLSNSTLTDNSADFDGNNSGDGGGIYRFAGTTQLKNTIVAGNWDHSPIIQHPDVSGEISGDADNLIGYVTGGSGTVGTGSDIVDPNPGLGLLGDNGGPTYTHALLHGSPALNAVSDCTDLDGTPLTLDQRGVSRPQGPACDIGAYEYIPRIFLPLVLKNAGS